MLLAGANTFASNSTNVALKLPVGVHVPAVGNTWDPGVQGAAPAESTNPPPGAYAVPSGETVLTVTGPATGKNYVLGGNGAASTVLRLAEQ